MSHALIPDFSFPLLGLPERVPFHADPILAAIERHEDAYAVFQVAPEGEASSQAAREYDAALDALLATPCTTRFGAFALLRHLRWWLGEEAQFSESYQPGYGVAAAREADLTLLLGCDGVARIPTALPLGRLPTIEAAPAPAPILALPRPARAVAAAGELLAALVLVGGGAVLTGLSTLI